MTESEVLFISVFNYGAIEIAQNHLESLKKNGITNYMAYVLDKESFDFLQEKGYNVEHFTNSENEISKGKEDFGTKAFQDINYIRYRIIQQLLEQGKTVWYMDVDTVVLVNLIPIYHYFANMHKYDMIFQDDINMACCGCILCFPTSKSIDIIKKTYELRNSADNDQIQLNQLLQTKISQENMQVTLFPRMEFPNGLLCFHEKHGHKPYLELQQQFYKYKSENKPIYFVHANWMIGIDVKIAALKEKRLWFL